jgi:hypothetical protein
VAPFQRPGPIVLESPRTPVLPAERYPCLREEAIDQGDGMNTTHFQTRTAATPTNDRRDGQAVPRGTMFRSAMSDCHRVAVLRSAPTGDMPPPTDRASDFARRAAPPERYAPGSL